MSRFRVTVRTGFIGYVQARSYPEAVRMARIEYGKFQAIERSK
jgi:hypothetical protein